MNTLASEPLGSGTSISVESLSEMAHIYSALSDRYSHIALQCAPRPPGPGKEGSNFDWLYWCQPFTNLRSFPSREM